MKSFIATGDEIKQDKDIKKIESLSTNHLLSNCIIHINKVLPVRHINKNRHAITKQEGNGSIKLLVKGDFTYVTAE